MAAWRTRRCGPSAARKSVGRARREREGRWGASTVAWKRSSENRKCIFIRERYRTSPTYALFTDHAAAAHAAVEAAVAAADGGDKGQQRAAQERAAMSELVSVTAEEGRARAEAEAVRRKEAAEAARRRAEELG